LTNNLFNEVLNVLGLNEFLNFVF